MFFCLGIYNHKSYSVCIHYGISRNVFCPCSCKQHLTVLSKENDQSTCWYDVANSLNVSFKTCSACLCVIVRASPSTMRDLGVWCFYGQLIKPYKSCSYAVWASTMVKLHAVLFLFSLGKRIYGIICTVSALDLCLNLYYCTFPDMRHAKMHDRTFDQVGRPTCLNNIFVSKQLKIESNWCTSFLLVKWCLVPVLHLSTNEIKWCLVPVLPVHKYWLVPVLHLSTNAVWYLYHTCSMMNPNDVDISLYYTRPQMRPDDVWYLYYTCPQVRPNDAWYLYYTCPQTRPNYVWYLYYTCP